MLQVYKNEEHKLGTVTASIPDDFQDLSLCHTPLGCLVSELPGRQEWEELKLTPKQVDQFWRDGYISNIPVLTDEQCQKLLDDYKVFLVNNLSH